MAPKLPRLVERTLSRLIRTFSPEQVVLFGSYAKGTQHGSSDVDLLIVADLAGSPEIYSKRARQLCGDCFPHIDVVFATPAEVLAAERDRSPFLLSILGTGVVIHRREGLKSGAGGGLS
jgi:UTP:GlnB (protein PII) uridylyltransferase